MEHEKHFTAIKFMFVEEILQIFMCVDVHCTGNVAPSELIVESAVDNNDALILTQWIFEDLTQI